MHLYLHTCEEKYGSFLQVLRIKTSRVGCFPLSPRQRLCILTSSFSRTCFCSLSLPLTAPKQQTDDPTRSPTFLWFEYQKDNPQSRNRRSWRLFSTVLSTKWWWLLLLDPWKNPSNFVWFLFPVLVWFREYCGHVLCSSGAGLGAEVFSLAFYKLCVCSKCRNSSKFLCSVLTWSPFEVDKYQLFKQKIKQKQLKTYSEVNRWTVCKTKQFPKGIFSTWSLFNSWLKINNADSVWWGAVIYEQCQYCRLITYSLTSLSINSDRYISLLLSLY